MKSVPLSGKATVDAMANEWGKVLAIYTYREGLSEIVITSGDIKTIMENLSEPTLVVQELDDGLHIHLLSLNDAVKLAKQFKGGFGKS